MNALSLIAPACIAFFVLGVVFVRLALDPLFRTEDRPSTTPDESVRRIVWEMQAERARQFREITRACLEAISTPEHRQARLMYRRRGSDPHSPQAGEE